MGRIGKRSSKETQKAIAEAATLSCNIKDIRDELNIIKTIVRYQDTYAVPDVPYSFPDYTQRGIYVNTANVIADEVFIKARSKPVSCRPSRYGPDSVIGRGT